MSSLEQSVLRKCAEPLAAHVRFEERELVERAQGYLNATEKAGRSANAVFP